MGFLAFFFSVSGCLYTHSLYSRAYIQTDALHTPSLVGVLLFWMEMLTVYKFVFVCVLAEVAEKRPFLETGPQSVKLTPSWEDRNLPAAELNLRGLEADLDKAALDMDPPKDRCAVSPLC